MALLGSSRKHRLAESDDSLPPRKQSKARSYVGLAGGRTIINADKDVQCFLSYAFVQMVEVGNIQDCNTSTHLVDSSNLTYCLRCVTDRSFVSQLRGDTNQFTPSHAALKPLHIYAIFLNTEAFKQGLDYQYCWSTNAYQKIYVQKRPWSDEEKQTWLASTCIVRLRMCSIEGWGASWKDDPNTSVLEISTSNHYSAEGSGRTREVVNNESDGYIPITQSFKLSVRSQYFKKLRTACWACSTYHIAWEGYRDVNGTEQPALLFLDPEILQTPQVRDKATAIKYNISWRQGTHERTKWSTFVTAQVKLDEKIQSARDLAKRIDKAWVKEDKASNLKQWSSCYLQEGKWRRDKDN